MNNIESLIFYIFFFLLSVLLYGMSVKKQKKIYAIIAFLIPLCIAGLRHFVGTDYETYINLYKSCIKDNKTTDIGFFVICKISNLIGGYPVMFLIYNFLTLLFVYLSIEKEDKQTRIIAYFIYIFVFYISSFNVIRQMLSASIILYSYNFLIDKKKIKYIIFVLFASIFHKTALICLPLFLINLNNKKIKYIILAIIFIVVLNFDNILLLITKIEYFSHFSLYIEEYSGTINNKMFFVDLLVLIYLIINKKKLLNNKNSNNELYIFLYTISLIISLSGFVSPFFKRVSIYFKIPVIYSLATILISDDNKRQRVLNFMIITCYTIGIFIISIFILKHHEVVPYNFIGGKI